MSVLLLGSSLVTDAADPGRRSSRDGGAANGRALAYLAHEHFGEVFGTLYDLSTIAILWFAGCVGDGRPAQPGAALPAALRHGAGVGARRCGRWCWSSPRITFLVTIIFQADVDAQGGAYATGVLVLMSSAALAVTLAAHRVRQLVAGLPADHAGLRLHDRRRTSSSGRKASASPRSSSPRSSSCRWSRGCCDRPSCASRASTATKRPTMFIDQAATTGQVRVIANRPGVGDVAEYAGQDPRGARHAPAEAVGAGAVPRGRHRRRLGVQQRAEGARRRDRPVPRAALHEPGGARTPSPACCCTSAIAPARCRTPTSAGPKATRSPTCSSSSPSARATPRRSAREVLRQTEPDPERRPRIHLG